MRKKKGKRHLGIRSLALPTQAPLLWFEVFTKLNHGRSEKLSEETKEIGAFKHAVKNLYSYCGVRKVGTLSRIGFATALPKWLRVARERSG